MDQKDTENMTDQTLRSWDGMKPAEVSPFLWTRIRTRLFEKQPEIPIFQPALKIYLAVWIALVLLNTGFWLSNNAKTSSSLPMEMRSTFFSDDNPYGSYR